MSLRRRLGQSRMIEQSWRAVDVAQCGLLGLQFVERDCSQQPQILSLLLAYLWCLIVCGLLRVAEISGRLRCVGGELEGWKTC